MQELVYNRPNVISRVGSFSTFGCMLQIFSFLFLSSLCVYLVSAGKK